MTKLAILEEREEDKYEHITTPKCWICDPYKGLELPDALKNPKVRKLSYVIDRLLMSSLDQIAR